MKVFQALALAALTVGCSSNASSTAAGTDGGAASSYAPVIVPANFVATIDNPFLPLKPGTVFRHRAVKASGNELIEVTVTRETKVIMGVTCVVVHDLVTAETADGGAGAIVEDTIDWYAQDKDGNVWYFGENTKKYEGGQVSTKGSWEGAVDGAKPGIAMKGAPKVGDVYRQEYYAGQAEDQAQILSLTETITGPTGSYQGCIRTKDFTELEPEVVENKVFCRGVGHVFTEHVKGESEKQDLLSVTAP